MARGKDVSDFESSFSHSDARLAAVSVAAVTNVTSAFTETSVNRVGNCGRRRTFDDRDARALVRDVRKQ